MTNLRFKSSQLLDYVRALEYRNSHERGEQVLAELENMGLKPIIQDFRWTRSKNIIVDFSTDPVQNHILFSAHYDVIKDSPGANDNASGVAVLLGLCNELRHLRKRVRIVFFDREEPWLRTPVLRLGLLGSLSYVYKVNMRSVEAVYNLEFCGQGDFVAIWPVKDNEIQQGAVQQIKKAASRLGVPFKTTHIPWLLFSSDHLSFRLRGIRNAVTLSLLPSSQIPVLERLLETVSIVKLLTGQRPILPEPLRYIHSSEDTSSKLNEGSLSLMLSILLEIVRVSV